MRRNHLSHLAALTRGYKSNLHLTSHRKKKSRSNDHDVFSIRYFLQVNIVHSSKEIEKEGIKQVC
jgi:hypothetical protein